MAEEQETGRDAGFVFAVVGAFALLRGVLAASVPPIAAEAYYWIWSLDLRAGYVDHPPGVAVIIRLGSLLGLDGPIGVRLGSVLLGTLGAVVFFLLCRDLFGSRTARRCLVVVSFALYFMPMGIMATPDAPLIALWIVTLFCVWRAYHADGWGWWIAAGLANGLCILGKYNGMQLPGVIFVFLLATPRGRIWLRRPQPWVALVIIGAMIVPNMLWNSRQGAATLATPVREGIEFGSAVKHFAQYLVLPFAWMTPILCGLWIWRTVAGVRAGALKDERFLFCACASWIPLASFAPVSLLTQIHIHWLSPCFLMALPLALHEEWGGARPRLMRWGAGLQGVLIVTGLIPLVVAVATSWVPPEGSGPLLRASQEFRGGGQLAARLRAEGEKRAGPDMLIMSKDYHHASLMSWLVNDEYPVLPLKRKRFRQFVVLYQDGMYDGWDAIYVDKRYDDDAMEMLGKAFESCEPLPPEVILSGDQELRTYYLYWCRGFRGPL